jgi:hypothetical protein
MYRRFIIDLIDAIAVYDMKLMTEGISVHCITYIKDQAKNSCITCWTNQSFSIGTSLLHVKEGMYNCHLTFKKNKPRKLFLIFFFF